MIDQHTIQRIFDAADIVEVVGDFVTLKRAGQNYRGLSPFTDEKTPSFFVSPAKGIFKCFSSGKGGNAVTFLMELEKLSYPEALRYLAKKYNIEIEEKEQTPEQQKEKNERESMMIVSSYAQKYFSNTLKNTDEGKAIGLSYFKERGFQQHIIDKFQLGYCPKGRDVFTKNAIAAGYKQEFLVKTGLTIQKDSRLFDRFSGRVMFPIHSMSGKVIGFGGRILDSQDKKTAKYLNSPESLIYHKSHILYGLYLAKTEIIKRDKCYLVEGYTDVISMVQAGIENVVASSGTALTSEQVRIVKRFTPNMTIIYDGDPAGIKASLRGIDLVLEQGMNVKILLLPDGEDPDSFAKKMASTDLQQYIDEHERDFITFKTRLLMEEASGDPVKRANLITDIVRSIAVIPDGIARTVYIRECSKIMDINESVLYTEINKILYKRKEDEWKRKNYEKNRQQRAIENQTYNGSDNKVQDTLDRARIRKDNEVESTERELLKLMLHYGDHEFFLKRENGDEFVSVAAFILEQIEMDDLEFQHSLYKKLFDEVRNLLRNGRSIEHKYFTMHPDTEISTFSADLLSSNYDLSKLWTKGESHVETPDMKLKESVPETLASYKSRRLNQMFKEAREELIKVSKTGKVEEIMEVQAKIKAITDIRKNIAGHLRNRIIL